MDTVKAGEPAPDFALAEDGGAEGATLSRLRGRAVVVYFYPKDNTPGCTAEARDFSCVMDEFDKAEVHVIGISPDTVRSHVKFRDKHELKVRLASDEDTTIARAYGVWVQKQMYGRTFMGVERATFLIDREGRVARIWRNVRVPGHVDDVLAAVRSLQ